MPLNPNVDREISEEGLRRIEREEGFSATVYGDLGHGRGTPTIGYGHTNLSGVGPKVVPGQTMTKEEAEKTLRLVMDQVYEPALRRHITVPLNQNQWDAMASWVYNLGEPNLAKSRLLKLINQRRFDLVPAELMNWTYAGGKRLQGLADRRNREGVLFATPVPEIEPPLPTADAPAPTPLSDGDKLMEKAATATPVITALASAFGDWKVAAVFAAVAVAGIIALALKNRKEA